MSANPLWFQLNIVNCPNQELDLLSEELEKFGALSITLSDRNDDPILEPELGTTPLWPEVVIQALFSEAAQAEFIRDHLKHTRPSLTCTVELLEDKEWEKVWMENFKPQRFGKRLWICPSWSTPPDPHAVNLMLDPGLAFGTGTHPTTSLCLTWLEQADLTHKSLIDYGCGSGILSLAALKLGAKKVYAVDIDTQALQATQNNASINKLDETHLSITLPEDLTQPTDLLIANILLGPLIALKERFQELIKPKGQLIISGIIQEQAATLIEAYKPLCTLMQHHRLNEWSLLAFVLN
jgi:ribosomal protein L11 methyltransferase